MPELPEVESIRRALESEIVGREVTRVEVRTRSVVSLPGDPPAGFTRARSNAKPVRTTPALLLVGSMITALERRGKQLAILGSAGPAVGVQLGMTGTLLVGGEDRPHTHVVWRLDDGRRLRFVDARRFGLVAGHPSMEELVRVRWSSLGPDALTISAAALRRACAGRERAIKAVLLDQGAVAGVGNIYADEALFAARVDPGRQASSLTGDEIADLAKLIRAVLRMAIRAGGSTIRDYRHPGGGAGGYQTRHTVYGRAGRPCVVCGGPLAGVRLAQRATVYCPNCQA